MIFARLSTLAFCFAAIGLLVSPQLSAQTIEARSLDGSGNNVANPAWGVSSLEFFFAPSPTTPFSIFSRLNYGADFPAGNDYADGLGQMARPTAPNPRLISNLLSQQEGSIPEPTGLNDMAAWWLFGLHTDIAVGLTNTPLAGGPGEPVPIVIPQDDPAFTPGDTIDFNRAFSTQSFGIPGTREILNSPTAFLDLDILYQRNAFDNAAVRTGSKGLMRLQPSASGEMVMPTAAYIRAQSGNPFALAAVADHLAITGAFPDGIAIHTMLLREHNRVATTLDAYPWWVKWFCGLPIEFLAGPDAYDEALFQLSRAVVEAEMQAITYNEVLPTLGVKVGPYRGYDENAFPAVNIEHSTGPFRLENMTSLLSPRIDRNGDPLPEGPINNVLSFIPPFSYAVFLQQGTDPVIRGMLKNPAQRNGLQFEEGLRSAQPDFDTGLIGAINDLMATHIQRGRDRGLPPYTAVRKALGLPPVTSFADITSDEDLQADLAAVYSSVNEIDAVVGIQAEDRVRRSIFGPTALKLFERQFTITRSTDRFWHEKRMDEGYQLPLAMTLVGLNVRFKRLDLGLDRTLAGLIRDTTDIGGRGDCVRIKPRTKALFVQ